MTSDTARLMAAYNAYANKGMNEIVAKLPPELWEKDFGGFFGSIKALCDHIYRGDRTWLKRLSGLRGFEAAKHPLLAASFAKDAPSFDTVAEYLTMRAELDALVTAFAAELTDADLAAPLTFKNWAGETQSKNFGGLWLHFVNHGTHHRGAVSVYLDMAGIQNDFSNLIRTL